MTIPFFRAVPGKTSELILPDTGKGFIYKKYTLHSVSRPDKEYRVNEECTGYGCILCKTAYDDYDNLVKELDEWKLEAGTDVGETEFENEYHLRASKLPVSRPRVQYHVLAVDAERKTPVIWKLTESAFEDKFYPAFIKALRGSQRWATLSVRIPHGIMPFVVKDMIVMKAPFNCDLTEEEQNTILKKISDHVFH